VKFSTFNDPTNDTATIIAVLIPRSIWNAKEKAIENENRIAI
jgi:hypothetical protein